MAFLVAATNLITYKTEQTRLQYDSMVYVARQQEITSAMGRLDNLNADPGSAAYQQLTELDNMFSRRISSNETRLKYLDGLVQSIQKLTDAGAKESGKVLNISG